MGMFGEIDAASNAERLEKIILDAMNGEDWSDIRSAVKAFVRKNIVPMYYSECSESWGIHKPHPDILKEFPAK